MQLTQKKSPRQEGEFQGFPMTGDLEESNFEALPHKPCLVESGRIDDLTNGYSNFEI
jgi:hypothetical protein